MTTLYGIKTCDTVRKARQWLDQQSVGYRFHDFRQDGLQAERLSAWSKAVGWQKLLNTAGTTYRQLPPESKQDLDEPRALALMLAQPTLIKRPVLEHGDGVSVGFKPADYQTLFA